MLSQLFEQYETLTKSSRQDLSPDQLRKWGNPKKRALSNLLKLAPAGFSKRWRRPDPVPFDRPATRRAIRAITGRLAGAFARIRDEAAAAARGLGKLAKAESDPDDVERARREADGLVDRLDLSDLGSLAPELADDLGGVASDTVRRAMAQVGADGLDTLVDQVNAGAVAQARGRAAELVGMRWDEDGELVEARRASYRIDETTRETLRETIASGLSRNIGSDAIADEIEGSYAFSAERALTIAETEVAAVNGQASLESYHAARADGIGVRKQWFAEPGCCAVCEANAEAGPIDLDDEFPSGDDTTPAHPKCRCVVGPVVEDAPEAIGKAFDPRQERDERGRWTPGVASVAAAARTPGTGVRRAKVGPIRQARRIEEITGIDVQGFSHALDDQALRHTLKKHGSPARETLRGQKPITEADFHKVRETTTRPDSIDPGEITATTARHESCFRKRSEPSTALTWARSGVGSVGSTWSRCGRNEHRHVLCSRPRQNVRNGWRLVSP